MGCTLPLWPLVFYRQSDLDNDDGKPPPSCAIRFVPFLFTLLVWREPPDLDDDGNPSSSSSSPPTRCFYVGVLMGLLLGVTSEGGRISIDICFPLVHFRFAWRLRAADVGGSEYYEDVEQRRYLLLQRRARRGAAAAPLLHSTNFGPDDEILAVGDGDRDRGCGDPELDRAMWAIDFRLLPLALGHWSRKRAWVMSLAPLPFYFAFQRVLGLGLNTEPSVAVQLHVVPLISVYYHDRPRDHAFFLTLLYTLYLHRTVSIPYAMANDPSRYTAFVFFPLLWVFTNSSSSGSGCVISLCTVVWLEIRQTLIFIGILPIAWLRFRPGERAEVVLFLVFWLFINWSESTVHCMLLFLLWARFGWASHDRFLGLVLLPFLWVQYKARVSGVAACDYRVWLLPFLFLRQRNTVKRSVCVFPLFYVSAEDRMVGRSVTWSVLMLFWFRSRGMGVLPASKCCFLAPVFYCSSSTCPSCFS